MSLPGYPSGINKDAHLKDVDSVFSALKTGRYGLTAGEAALRLREYGGNKLKEAAKESLILIFLKKFTEPLILLLLASAAVSLFIGEVLDAIGIALAVGLVSILGFIQEYRSEKSVEALKKLTTHRCKVIREGAVYETRVEELVPGDAVALNVGDRVPADLRLFETLNL